MWQLGLGEADGSAWGGVDSGGDRHGRLVSEGLLMPAEAQDLFPEAQEGRKRSEPAKMHGVVSRGVAQNPGAETRASVTPEVWLHAAGRGSSSPLGRPGSDLSGQVCGGARAAEVRS